MRSTAGVGGLGPPTAQNPDGEFQDDSIPKDGTGTDIKAQNYGDMYYFMRALLAEANLSPDESSEGLVASQCIDALKSLFAKFTPGDIKATARLDPELGWYDCDGSNKSRTLDADLFYAITRDLGAATITIASPGVVTKTGHGMRTGSTLALNTDGTLPTPLIEDTNYFAIVIDADTFQMATSIANAFAGTAINTSGSQSGTHTVLYCPFGIFGASDFLLPDTQGVYVGGAGKTGRAEGVDATGASYEIGMGWYLLDQFQGHWHEARTRVNYAPPGNIDPVVRGSQSDSGSTDSIRAPITDTVHGTPRTGPLTRPPTIGLKYRIKY